VTTSGSALSGEALDLALERLAAEDGHASALRWRDETWGRATLRDAMLGWCGLLREHGVATGATVIVDLARGPDAVAAHLALLRVAALAVPVNAAATAAELAHVLADADPQLVVCDRGRVAVHDEALAAMRSEAAAPPPRRLVRSADDAAPPPAVNPEPAAARGDDDVAVMLYTSGTTGRPKGAMITHGNLNATASALRDAWELSPTDHLLHVLPLFHVHGLVVALHAVLGAGGQITLLPRFETDAVWRALGAGEVSVFMGVPTMYHRLLSSPPEGEARLDGLRLCTCGSAPLPAERLLAFERLTGQRILERYGLTEAGMVSGNPLSGERRAGGVGVDLPGVTTRLVDPASGEVVAPGAEGEVQLTGPQVFAGYRNRPEETEAAFTADGWLRTGDLGRRDDAGHLVLVGRLKELVISGGYNVHPPEVEAALREHASVSDAAVCGLPDDDLGERVAAAVVPAPGASPDVDELLAFCAERLAPYKRPRRLAIVDELPRNALGKVQRGRLPKHCGWTD
jgi:malonyl-CoA/methylmalonyl-CoA synthetase